MRKILVVANQMDCGGTEVAALAIINELMKKKDNQISLMLCSKKGVWLNRIPANVNLIEYSGQKNLREIYDKLSGLKKLFFIMKYLLNKISSRSQYDLLLSYQSNFEEEYDLVLDVNGYGYFMTAYVAKKIKARKKATWFHDEDLSWLFKIKSYLKCYDELFGVSKAVVDELTRRCPEYSSKIKLLYNPIDIQEIINKASYQAEDIFSKSKINILTVCRIHEQKGIDLIIKTSKILCENSIDFIWHIIGDGADREKYIKIAKELNLEDKVLFWGRKDNPYPYIANCDIYVQPSLHEGFGLTVLEARILEKLIVVTDLPCFREQILDNKNGFIVSIDSQELASKLINIISCGPKNYDSVAHCKSKIDYTEQFETLLKLLD